MIPLLLMNKKKETKCQIHKANKMKTKTRMMTTMTTTTTMKTALKKQKLNLKKMKYLTQLTNCKIKLKSTITSQKSSKRIEYHTKKSS